MRRSLPLLATLAAETGAVVLLYRFIREPGFAIPIGLGCAAWLLSSTLLYLGASLARVPTAIRAAGRITLPGLRRRVDRALAASILTGALVAGATPALAGTQPSPDPVVDETPTTAPVDQPSTDVPTDIPTDISTDIPTEIPNEIPSMAPVRTGRAGDPASVVDVSTSAPSPSPAPPPPQVVSVPERAAPAAPSVAPAPALPIRAPVTTSSYPVVPGDNLWEIAARHLAEVTGRDRAALSDADIVQYWVRVCDANRDRVRSGDVSLIYSGEVVELPPV